MSLNLEKGMVLHVNKIESTYPNNVLHQVLLWLSSSKEDFKIVSLHYYLPSEKHVALHLNKLKSSSPIHGYCEPSLVGIGMVVLENKIFISIYFLLLCNFPSWKRAWFSI